MTADTDRELGGVVVEPGFGLDECIAICLSRDEPTDGWCLLPESFVEASIEFRGRFQLRDRGSLKT